MSNINNLQSAGIMPGLLWNKFRKEEYMTTATKNVFTIHVTKAYKYKITRQAVKDDGIQDWISHLRGKAWYSKHIEQEFLLWANEKQSTGLNIMTAAEFCKDAQ